MAFKPIDPKRDEFRRYLEREGVIEALTKVFVRIVKERPENPIEYLRHNLGDSLQQADNVAYLQGELSDARIEIQRLRDIIKSVSPEALEPEVEQQQPHREEADGDQSHENNVAADNVAAVEIENHADTTTSQMPATLPTETTAAGVPAIPQQQQQQSDAVTNIIGEAVNNCHINDENSSAQKTDNNI